MQYPKDDTSPKRGAHHVGVPQDTGKVVKHIEAWDVEPGAVVRSLIRPSARMPTTPWEAFFSALDAGDPKGAWLAASRPLAKYYALPVVALSLLAKLLTGQGLPVRHRLLFCVHAGHTSICLAGQPSRLCTAVAVIAPAGGVALHARLARRGAPLTWDAVRARAGGLPGSE